MALWRELEASHEKSPLQKNVVSNIQHILEVGPKLHNLKEVKLKVDHIFIVENLLALVKDKIEKAQSK